MRYCTRCILPDTRPGLVLGPDGTCSACRAHGRKLALSQLETLAGEHRHAAPAGPLGQLADQPALADAGLTRHEHHGTVTGLGACDRRLERRELVLAPYEDAAGDGAGHVPIMPR